jgi:hypothetical protein
MRTTAVTVIGKITYFIDMVRIAERYTLMGCIVNMRFNPFTLDPEEVERLRKVHTRMIEMADIVHVVHYENVDEQTTSDIIYAKNIGKVITYVVPKQPFIDSFDMKDDNFILGPLKWTQYINGYQLSDIHGKIVPVEKGMRS